MLVLVACGCAYPPPLGVLRIDHKHPPKSVEGPIVLNFGPFDSRWDALIAACPLILSMPGATAGRQDGMGFDVRWRMSREYCSWVYYTPDRKYEMSMLVEGPESLPYEQNKRSCQLPMFVEDKRYAKESLEYVYFLHGHPEFPTTLSERDMEAIALIRKHHGSFAATREGNVSVGFIAFFANSYSPVHAECDGFFEYRLGSNEVLKWTHDEQGRWHSEEVATVARSSGTEARFQPRRPDGP
jgi:proteasome lid subunit RPN8/RPN11